MSIKKALGSRKIEQFLRKNTSRNAQFGEIIEQNPHLELWISLMDLDYANSQMQLSKTAQKHCIFAIMGGNCIGYCRLLRDFLGIADMPPLLQQKLDETLYFEFLAWRDDIIVLTRGNIDTRQKEVEQALTKLQNASYRASVKAKLLKTETELLGQLMNENEIRPTTD